MLRVLTLSTLFPSALRPAHGIFVERQTLGLASLNDVEVQVVAPVGIPPWPLSRHPHYARRRSLPFHEEWKGLELHRPRYPVLPVVGTRGTARRMAAALLPLLKELYSAFRFDVIDAEFFWPDGPAAVALGDALDVPVSIKARGSDINFWSRNKAVLPQLRAAGEGAHGLLAVSEALKANMVELGMPEDRIRVHYTGIDLERFRPFDRNAVKAELGITGPLLVTVAALIPGKGQALTLEALLRLPEATLLLAGEGPDRARLEALAATLGLSSRVRFLGSVSHEDVARLLGAADVTILASRSEGLANVWVESLACGTPVVTTDVGGAKEVISSDVGTLVSPDAAAIADAVQALLAGPPNRERIRERDTRFSWERNARELRAHLQEISGAA